MARCLCRIALFLCAFAGLAWAHAVGLSRGEYERTPQGVHANLVFAAPDVAFATRASLSEHALSVSQRGKDCLATRSTADATNDGGVQLRASFACPRTDQPVSVSLDFLSLMGPGHRHHAALRQGALESESIHVAPNAKLELGALINAVIDVGRLTSVPTPYLEAASACAGLLNQRIVDDGVAFAPAAVRK